MKVPDAEHAVVDIRKLRDYCLNSTHEHGKHKARLFLAALGITAIDAQELRNILLEAVKTHDAELGRRDVYGVNAIMWTLSLSGVANRQQFGVPGLSSTIRKRRD